MRRFWKSTEFYMTAALALVLVLALAPQTSEPQFTLALSVLLDSYVLGRTLWKKNRGNFWSATRSSEFYFIVGLHFWVIYAWHSRHLSAPYAGFFLVANQALYSTLRGLTKSVGVKTQMLV